MAKRKAKALPKLCFHKSKKTYYIRINGKTYYLGADINVAEAERLRLIREWQSSIGVKNFDATAKRTKLLVSELFLEYVKHIQIHYRKPDGTATSEQQLIRLACRPLRRLYGHTFCDEFDVQRLEIVRTEIINNGCGKDPDLAKANGKTVGCSRGVTNQHIGRIVRMFKWAAGKKLVPASVYHELTTLQALQKHRSEAREYEEIPPAPEESIAAVLKIASPTISAMIQFQLLTGCRPGECCQLRKIDLVFSGKINNNITVPDGTWAYLPKRHKTEHHKKDRIIPVGPKAQEILEPFMGKGDEEYFFQSWESRRWFYEQKRDKKLGEKLNRKRGIYKRQWSEHGYNKAVQRLCKKAGVEVFHVNQLRHNAATRLQDQFGWDVARIILGHTTVSTTKIYVQENMSKVFQAIQEGG